MATTPPCCISLTTDAKYFLPALVTAMQARRFAGREKADVAIFAFGIEDSTQELFAKVCGEENILLHFVDQDVLEGRSILLSRLVLNRFVPQAYTQHLFIDSDLRIDGSLDPLLDANVSEGRFLACNDPFTFAAEDDCRLSRDFKQHLASIGLAAEQATSYFNAGVLRMDRAGWEQVGIPAWDLYKSDKESRFQDQDLLNIVGHAKRLPMSLTWNFPIFLRNCGVESEVQPRVYHFMSNPKPWHGSFPPWNARFAAPYQELVQRYPQLAPFCPRMTPVLRLLYQGKQRKKRLMEGRAWSNGTRRARLRAYQATCVV